MEQLDLLSNPDANTLGKFQRPTDAAETQRTAAVLAYPTTGTWRRKVLDAITNSGNYGRNYILYGSTGIPETFRNGQVSNPHYGMTDEEIQDALRMNPSTQRPRRVELVEGGWIVDSQRRRRTRARRDAVVWVTAARAHSDTRLRLGGAS